MKIWPWSTISELEHKLKLADDKNELLLKQILKHRTEAEETAKHVRKMAKIMAITGGFKI